MDFSKQKYVPGSQLFYTRVETSGADAYGFMELMNE